MEQVYIREVNGEVLILLDKHLPDKISTLEEAIRVLKVEIIRERTNSSRNFSR
jgi:hypothetical protein